MSGPSSLCYRPCANFAVRDKQDSERRLVQALASQLKMNRKTIVVANEMKEVPLFDSVENSGLVQTN